MGLSIGMAHTACIVQGLLLRGREIAFECVRVQCTFIPYLPSIRHRLSHGCDTEQCIVSDIILMVCIACTHCSISAQTRALELNADRILAKE